MCKNYIAVHNNRKVICYKKIIRRMRQMSVQERSGLTMPENTVVKDETVEKQIALSASWGAPDTLPPHDIIGTPYHMLWSLIY